MPIKSVEHNKDPNPDSNAVWGSGVENYPPGLVAKIFDYVSKKGRTTDIKNISAGFLKRAGKGRSVSIVSVQFTDRDFGVQYIIFEKRSRGLQYAEWKVLKESEIMPSTAEEVKKCDDWSLNWVYVYEN